MKLTNSIVLQVLHCATLRYKFVPLYLGLLTYVWVAGDLHSMCDPL